MLERGVGTTGTDRYRVWAALGALLLLVVFILGCGADDEQKNASGQTGKRSTGAPVPDAKYDLVCRPSWSSVSSPQELVSPTAITARAKNDIWVVGRSKVDRGTGTFSTGAQHWDGRSWSLSPAPNAGAGEHMLNGVDALAKKDVWAVGYSQRPGGRYETLVEHWNGDHWRVVKSPNAGTNQYNALTSVDAVSSSNAWAVGSYRTATSRKTLIERWNGTSWRIVSSPNPATQSNSLLGVAAAGPNDIWAVGWKSSGDGLRSLVLHHHGTRWTEVAVPTVGPEDNVLSGISAVSDNDVWTTGYYVDGTKHKTLTLHYNGTTWRHVPTPNGEDGTSVLRDVGAFSSTNAWAVGFEYRETQNRYVASTQRWDGSTWSAVPSAISGYAAKESEMFSVARAPDTSRVWAAGFPANVESICPPERPAATFPRHRTGPSTTSANGSKPTPESSSSEEPLVSNAPALRISAPRTSVIAVDKAADAGIAQRTPTLGAIIADFNNDRRPDIFLGRHRGVASLYKNAGSGHFEETNKGAFVKTDRHGCDAADVNSDGLKDIFCSTGATQGTLAKRNELYVQQADHTFADQADRYGVLDPFGRGRLSTFIDANGDTSPDLFVGNEPDRGDGMPSPDRFFINQGGDTYRYIPDYGFEREMDINFRASTSVGDLDKDGWEDLILATPSGLRVYHNDEGKGFTDVAASLGLGQSLKAVTLSDVNDDSWPDVIGVSRNELRVLLNTGGTFTSVFSTTLEYASSVAAGDVNGDNRPDVYVMRGEDATGDNAPDQVYLNDGDGTSFTRMPSIPSTSEGGAESVWPIDHDQNGLSDFLVLNGAKGKGPVQLIAFFPAT